MAQYSRDMEPVEQRIAGKLRQKLSKLDAHPQQVSYICIKLCIPTYIRTHIIMYVGCMYVNLHMHVHNYVHMRLCHCVYVCLSIKFPCNVCIRLLGVTMYLCLMF